MPTDEPQFPAYGVNSASIRKTDIIPESPPDKRTLGVFSSPLFDEYGYKETLGNFRRTIGTMMDNQVFVPNCEGCDTLQYKPIQEPSALVRETLRQVNDIQKTINEIHPGWFHTGGKHDVPRNACYSGKWGKNYVWVCPENREDLAKFTLAVLKLAAVVKDTQVIAAPSGIQFSPVYSLQPH